MKKTREQVMVEARSEIARGGYRQRPQVISEAVNFSKEPTTGLESSLLQYGLTRDDLAELRTLGGTENVAMRETFGIGRNFKREVSQRWRAEKDRINDRNVNAE